MVYDFGAFIQLAARWQWINTAEQHPKPAKQALYGNTPEKRGPKAENKDMSAGFRASLVRIPSMPGATFEAPS